MPNRRQQPPPSRSQFRERYAGIERRRAELVERLGALEGRTQAHPAYKRARKLLNDTFRREKLSGRMAVLQAAAWLIEVLEQLAMLT